MSNYNYNPIRQDLATSGTLAVHVLLPSQPLRFKSRETPYSLTIDDIGLKASLFVTFFHVSHVSTPEIDT